MMYGFEGFSRGFGMMGAGAAGIFGGWMLIILVWSIFWKGLALWHSAQRKEPWWFVILLLVNTAGILEIIYLFAVAKLKFDQLFSKTTSSKGV